MSPRVAALLLVAALLAGCSGGGDPVVEPGLPSDGPVPEPEPDNAVLYIAFESAGPATLEVPFPTIDSCRGAAHWMGGDVESTNATATLREATDGRNGHLVAVTGTGRVTWSSQIDPGDRCMPVRFDPWSTDPDPEGEAVEVRASEGAPEQVAVLVRLVRGGCGNATLYDGPLQGSAWTALAGRTVPTSCA